MAGMPGPDRAPTTVRAASRAAPPTLAAILAVLAGVLWTSACAGGTPAVEPSTELRAALREVPTRSGAAEAPAPVVPDPGWTFRRLDGSTLTLGELRGRPVFVNFWATWCPPCVAELSTIGALAGRLADTEVAFVLVSAEETDAVRRFARRLPDVPSPVLEETLAPEAFGRLVLPTTAVLDHQGRLVLLHRGAEDWSIPEVEALLRRLDRQAAS